MEDYNQLIVDAILNSDVDLLRQYLRDGLITSDSIRDTYWLINRQNDYHYHPSIKIFNRTIRSDSKQYMRSFIRFY